MSAEDLIREAGFSPRQCETILALYERAPASWEPLPVDQWAWHLIALEDLDLVVVDCSRWKRKHGHL